MKNLIFTVYDQKAHAYVAPFFLHTEGMAIREFKDACNNPQHSFGRHPEDYTLFKLGTFNDATAHFELLGKAETIGNGLQFVDAKKDSAQLNLINTANEAK